MGPVVALLPHPIPEENGTGRMKDGQELNIARTRILPGSILREQTTLKTIIDILQWAHLSALMNS